MFTTSVRIDAAIDDVWAVLADVERWPEWTASVADVKLQDDGPVRVGSKVRIKQPRLPATTWEVTELDPGRAFTWKTAAPGVASVAEHRLAADGPSATTATLELRRTGPLARVLDALFAGITRRYVTMEAEGLKRRSEQGR